MTVDGEYFTQLLDETILPACEALGIRSLPMDNARPHIVDNDKASIKAVLLKHPSIKIIYQPPQSPDTNPLDEGIFKTLADHVEDKDPQNRETLITTVRNAWNELGGRTVVAHIVHQRVVRRKIISADGGNRFL